MSLLNTKSAIILGLLTTLVAFGASATPAFAHSDFISTQITPSACISPGCAIGTTVTDTVTFCLSTTSSTFCAASTKATVTCAQGANTKGTICYEVHSGTCASIGALVSPGPSPSSTAVLTSNDGSTKTYTSTLSTTGLAAGSYVWIVQYSGMSVNTDLHTLKTCEPFTLTVGHGLGVPEFPSGVALLMALAIPALLLVRSKSKIIAA